MKSAAFHNQILQLSIVLETCCYKLSVVLELMALLTADGDQVFTACFRHKWICYYGKGCFLAAANKTFSPQHAAYFQGNVLKDCRMKYCRSHFCVTGLFLSEYEDGMTFQYSNIGTTVLPQSAQHLVPRITNPQDSLLSLSNLRMSKISFSVHHSNVIISLSMEASALNSCFVLAFFFLLLFF